MEFLLRLKSRKLNQYSNQQRPNMYLLRRAIGPKLSSPRIKPLFEARNTELVTIAFEEGPRGDGGRRKAE